MTGGPPWAGGSGDGTACESAGSVITPRRSDTAADRTSLSFTEEMKGFHLPGACASSGTGPAARGQRFMFRLTITADDMDRFLRDRDHLARAEGWIDAAAYGGRRPVQRGWFNLFAPADAPDRRLMRYRLHFTDALGRPRTLAGWKNIDHGPPTEIWPDTTTLFYRVLVGHVFEGEDDGTGIAGAGSLRISLIAFMRQLTTFRARGPRGLLGLIRFGCFFAGQLWRVYGLRRAPRLVS